MMDAVVLTGFGGPELLRYERGLSAPTVPSGHVLVEVHAAGVNPVDAKTRRGDGVARSAGPPPFILGWDLAGVVVERGYGARFEVGERVMGMAAFPLRAGCYATLCAARARELARIPEGMSAPEAAALPLAGLTALQVLREDARLAAGQRVGIVGAGGVVGQLALQLARRIGAEVVAIARGKHRSHLEALGASEVIQPEDLPRAIGGELGARLDVLVELTASPTGTEALGALRPGGLALWVADEARPLERQRAAERGIRIVEPLVEPDGHQVGELAELAARGGLTVPIDAQFRLAEAADAHRRLERGGGRGKLVLVPESRERLAERA